MKKLIILSSVMLFLLSCKKSETSNLKENVSEPQTLAWNADLYVTKVKYTRNMVMLNNGKYDCSKAGDNCNVTKRPEDKKLIELAILDTYIASSNSAGYFAHNNWHEIFPEITVAGINALIDHQIFVYKKEGNDGSRTYILSSASSSNNVVQDNIIATWQFAE